MLYFVPRLFGERHSNSNDPDLWFNVSVFTFISSGMKTLRAFLIMGCGFSSSALNLRLRGSKISCPGTLERARSAGSGSYPVGTWMESGSIGLGVSREEGRTEGQRERERRRRREKMTLFTPFK